MYHEFNATHLEASKSKSKSPLPVLGNMSPNSALSPRKHSIEAETAEIDQLKNWKGFMSYEFSFVLIMFLELFWNRMDTLICSLYFTEVEIATQSSWMNVVMTMDCFAYGFGIATASRISNYIVQGHVNTSIKSAIIANITVFCLGLGFATL